MLILNERKKLPIIRSTFSFNLFFVTNSNRSQKRILNLELGLSRFPIRKKIDSHAIATACCISAKAKIIQVVVRVDSSICFKASSDTGFVLAKNNPKRHSQYVKKPGSTRVRSNHRFFEIVSIIVKLFMLINKEYQKQILIGFNKYVLTLSVSI